MHLRSPDTWSCLLWEHFLPEIQNGNPFYLAVDQALIFRLGKAKLAADCALKEVLKEFNHACISLLDIKETKAAVKCCAFGKIPDHCYSRVICLAVQQIIAVELMLGDSHYSEASYFPRYRSCLGLTGANEHLNPLDGNDFQRIWIALKREISATQGASELTVTFSPGLGPDKNRKLPLSQALLTTDDLVRIRELVPNIVREKDSKNTSILETLFHIRNNLGRRARKLITSSEYIKNKLCDQIRSFLVAEEIPEISIRRKRSSSVKSSCGQIVAFPASDEDWFDDAINVFLRLDNGHQGMGTQLVEALETLLLEKDVIVLIPRDDGYVQVQEEESLALEDSIITIARRSSAASIRSRIEKHMSADTAERFEERKSNLPPHFCLQLAYDVSGVSKNFLLGRPQPPFEPSGIELRGGLLVDARSKIFLAGYPPREFWFQGRRVGDSTLVVVENREMSARDFLNGLGSESDFQSHTLQFQGQRIEFALSKHKKSTGDQNSFGYLLKDDVFEISTSLLNTDQQGLRGVCLVNLVQPSPRNTGQAQNISMRELLSLVSKGKRISIAPEGLTALLESIKRITGQDKLVQLALHQICAMRSVPAKALIHSIIRKLAFEDTSPV